MLRQLSFRRCLDCFELGASTLILVLRSRSKTHPLAPVHEERPRQNGGEALVLVEQGQGYLVHQELAGRCLRGLPDISGRASLDVPHRRAWRAPFPYP